MPRIPEGELERLKREISIERLAESQGVTLSRKGADLVGLCPFHDDQEPSLVVTPSKNLWHCLGACQAGGSVVDWVMRAEGVSFRHAVELLQADYAPSPVTAAKRSTVQKLPTALEGNAEDARLVLQQAGLREPHARTGRRRRTGRRGPPSVASCSGSGSSGPRATST